MKRALLIAGLALAIVSPANAFDATRPILDEHGAAIIDQFEAGKLTEGKKCGDAGEKPCLTVASAIVHALLLCIGPPYCKGEDPNGDAKYKRTKMADKIAADPHNVVFGIDEAPVVKGVVGEMYTPIVVRQVWDAMEPAKPEEKK